MYPRIVKLDIDHEPDGFEQVTLTRLLNSPKNSSIFI